MSATYRGKPIKDMSRTELEAAVIFLDELTRKLANEDQPKEKQAAAY